MEILSEAIETMKRGGALKLREGGQSRGTFASIHRRLLSSLLSIFVVLPVMAGAQELPIAEAPEKLGFSSQRLQRITEYFKTQVDQKAIPGAVLMVGRRGKIAYFQAMGLRDPEGKDPMPKDGIFTLASLTKPVVSVAVMMLAEEGRLAFGDPVSRYLPQFRGIKVGVERRDANGNRVLELEPAKAEMTILDLLRHTSGLTSSARGEGLVKAAYLQMAGGAGVFYGMAVGNGFRPDQLYDCPLWVDMLSKIPLAHQPGTTWDYSASTDLLSCVVEAASGMTLGAFVQERIAKPLNLPDFGFYVPKANQGRLVESFIDKATGKRVAAYRATEVPRFFSGGAGMVSSVPDYARFLQMLLNGGELGGVRLVSRTAVSAMTTNQLRPGTVYAEPLSDSLPSPEVGQGWGFNVNVRTAAGVSPLMGSQGSYYWSGASGPYFWADPKEELFAILFIQGNVSSHLKGTFRHLVYQALVD